MSTTVKSALAILLLTTTAACARGDTRERLAYVERPAETIYSEAFERLERNRLLESVALFDEVERQHPYSEWARRAMLMGAYVNYQNNNYDVAIATAERYVALYPGGDNAAYAYYLIALCHYERILDVGRDQKTTQDALNALSQVARRYPQTDYARDARLKIEMTLDHLAGKEMEVGRWYLRQGHHLAAINRFQTVIEQYDTTTHAAEALHRLVESYVALGVDEEATRAAAVLGYNYPGSRWYQDSYTLLANKGVVQAETGAPLADPPEEKPRGVWGNTVGRVF